LLQFTKLRFAIRARQVYDSGTPTTKTQARQGFLMVLLLGYGSS